MPTLPYRFLTAGVVALALFAAACSDDDSDSVADESAAGDSAADQDQSGDDGMIEIDLDEMAGSGQATVTIDGETWSFDAVMCGVGETELDTPGAELNLAGLDGSISFYIALEPGGSYIELADLEAMDDGGLYYTTMGVGTPEPTIEMDGRSFTATADFYTFNDMGGQDGPIEGTVSGTCG